MSALSSGLHLNEDEEWRGIDVALHEMFKGYRVRLVDGLGNLGALRPLGKLERVER